MGAGDAQICDVNGKGGFFLPLSQAERTLDKKTRGVIYLICLLYVFMGVGVVSDFFMSAIEMITAKKRRVVNKATGRLVTVLVWNETVANLTLLALGSSAPEILLSCLEIMGAGFHSGELGPSTIVGSAAFNLLVIVAVCIYAIPSPEVRYIKYVSVFHVTVIFSLFAYFWLLVIVKFNSADVIEMWEAFVTLLLFPILVVVSYAADRGYLEFLSLEQASHEKSVALVAAVTNSNISRVQDGSLAFRKTDPHPRLRAGSNQSLRPPKGANTVRKSIAGPSKPQLGQDGRLDRMLPAGDQGDGVCDTSGNYIKNPAGVLTFREDVLTVNGEAEPKEVLVEVLRRNGCSGEVSCRYHTEALSSKPDYDYEQVRKGLLIFADGETHRMIKLKILPKRDFERNDIFQVILEDPEGGAVFNPNDDGGAEHSLLTVTIRNEMGVRPHGVKDQCTRVLEMVIDRDSLMFGCQSWRNQIRDAFAVDPEDEGEEVDEDDTELQKLMKGTSSQPSPLDYIMHVITLPWKVLFAVLCPPAHWANGWVLFLTALGMVGGVTALVADLASMFGCCFEFGDATTAITIVALGTSLPDLFASQSSARNDEHADASVVNVTGSNSVNVYLGIGLPWTMAAVYWSQAGANADWVGKYPDLAMTWPSGAFVVRAGELGFSVTIFTCTAIIALSLLRARRVALKGELGGPTLTKVASSATFVLLWITYLGLSIWRIHSDSAEVVTMPMICIALFAVAACISLECVLWSAGHRTMAQAPRSSKSRASQQSRASKVRPSQAVLGAVPERDAERGEGACGEDGKPPQDTTRTRISVLNGEGSWSEVTGKALGVAAPPTTLGRGSELRLVEEAEAAAREERERRASRKRESKRGSRMSTTARPTDLEEPGAETSPEQRRTPSVQHQLAPEVTKASVRQSQASVRQSQAAGNREERRRTYLPELDEEEEREEKKNKKEKKEKKDKKEKMVRQTAALTE